MKNKNKKFLSVIGLSTIAITGILINLNKIDSHAYGNVKATDTNSAIRWDGNYMNNRPISGVFKDNTILPKNPSFPNIKWAYVGEDDSTTYKMPNGVKVRSAEKKGYGYSILYYEAYRDNNGIFKSPMFTMKENYFAEFDSTLKHGHEVEYWDLKDVYSHNYKGSETNFSKYTTKPNYGGKRKMYLASNAQATGTYDNAVGVHGEWRYIGYNQLGQAVENPYFPPDGDGSETPKSSYGVLNQNFAGDYPNAKRFFKPTTYDDIVYIDNKKSAFERLLNNDPSFRQGIIKVVNQDGSVSTFTNGNIDANLWANALSLETNPLTETPVFKGYLPVSSYVSNSAKLHYTNVVAPTDPKITTDVYVKSIKIIDSNGQIVKKFERDDDGENFKWIGTGTVVPGNKYTIRYTIKNTGDEDLPVNPTLLNVGYALDGNTEFEATENQKYIHNNANWEVSQPGTIKANSTKDIDVKMTVPLYCLNAFKVTGYINDEYNKQGVNANINNDWSSVRTGVKWGDLSVENIEMIDRQGNVINDQRYMKPGEDYKFRYTYRYDGPDREAPLDFKSVVNVKRYLPNGESEVKKFDFAKNNVYFKDGSKITFDTPYITFERPKADVSVSIENEKSTFNATKENDVAEKSYNYDYDVRVYNVRTYNKNERPTQNGYITVGLKYDVDVIAPKQVPYFETDLVDVITLPNGKELEFIDHVKKGTNKDITREIKIPVNVISSGSKELPFKVHVNKNKHFYENDLATQANNVGSTSAIQLPPINPLTVQGCPLGTANRNYWTQDHTLLDYSGYNVSYQKFNKSATFNFYKYDNSQPKERSTRNKYNESYVVESVKFKSKYTEDKGYGWVNLMTSEKNKAKIKAGYGYQLQVTVKYDNNALATQPMAWENRNNSNVQGKSVSNSNFAPNIYKDIYVKTGDGKVLSATGMYGTIPAFDATVVKSDKNSTVIRYTMKNTSNNGINEPLRIYTDEDTKDGAQNIKVWTPVISGVVSPANKKELCDSVDVQYEIKGSMFDDNNDHIAQ